MNHNIFTAYFISSNKPEGAESSDQLTVMYLVRICPDFKTQGAERLYKRKKLAQRERARAE